MLHFVVGSYVFQLLCGLMIIGILPLAVTSQPLAILTVSASKKPQDI